MGYYNSELPRPIPRNSMESDHGCTSRIFFDNAGDNVTLTSQKPCLHNNKCDAATQTALNEDYVSFSIKYRYSDISLKKKQNKNKTSFILLI